VKNITVKDLMVPISEYANVPLGTTLFEATLVLEKAQELYEHSKYRQRAILVLDENEKVVGKISQLRLLKALETGNGNKEEIDELIKFKFGEPYIEEQREKIRLDIKLLTDEALAVASERKVETFMQQLTPGEYVNESSSLDMAIHKLVAGTHLSLLVTRNEEIVGILRMSDVFAVAFQAMKKMKIPGTPLTENNDTSAPKKKSGDDTPSPKMKD
jgi:CBS domain-containing protein